MSAGRYAFIDAVPDRLFDAVIANAHGKLRPRTDAVLALRRALLDGALPAREQLAWPEPELRQPLLDALAGSGIARHCVANARLTDDVLAGLLGAADVAQKRYDELLADLTLVARELDRHVYDVGLDAATWQRVRDDAARIAGRVALEALRDRERQWSERHRDWIEVSKLLDEIAHAGDVDSTRVPGVLQAIDWRHSAELRRLLAGLPAMTSLVRALGRGHAPDAGGPAALETCTGPVQREIVVAREVRELDRVEIRGIERGDELVRMLASELALRLVPATTLVWHARRAERALLTYQPDATHVTHQTHELGFRDGLVTRHARAERGPIIVILDTSGSMAGQREVLAKALVLQVLCIAELEARACYVYNFSGDGDVIEHQLALAGEGLAHALAFLAMSFSGGTVIDEPLRRAIARIETAAWSQADVLIVTDGEIDVPEQPFDRTILRTLARVREHVPFRVHVALASRAPAGVVDEIADETHDLVGWIDTLAPVS